MSTVTPAVADAQGRPLDRIVLRGLSAHGWHGVLDSERTQGQTFGADVTIYLDVRDAADDLANTVDYAHVAEDVVAILTGEPVNLVETLAERIAGAVLARPAVAAVDVTVHKPQAPIGVPFDDVEVTIRRDASDLDAFEPAAVSVAAAAPVVPVPAVDGVAEPLVPEAPPEAEPADFPAARDRMDEKPEGFVQVVIALGANLGDAQETLREAVTDIDRIAGLEVTEVSPLARTAAVGDVEQPDYLNAVLLARTQLSPRELLHACQAVENAHGRTREEHWGPRTLDIDLIVYDGMADVAADLEIPHPRAHERAFVLEPWAQIEPDAVLPGLGGGPVAALAATAPDREGIRWLALDWLTEQPEETPEATPPAPPEVAPAAGSPVPVPAPGESAGTAMPPAFAPSGSTGPSPVSAAPVSAPPAPTASADAAAVPPAPSVPPSFDPVGAPQAAAAPPAPHPAPSAQPPAAPVGAGPRQAAPEGEAWATNDGDVFATPEPPYVPESFAPAAPEPPSGHSAPIPQAPAVPDVSSGSPFEPVHADQAPFAPAAAEPAARRADAAFAPEASFPPVEDVFPAPHPQGEAPASPAQVSPPTGEPAGPGQFPFEPVDGAGHGEPSQKGEDDGPAKPAFPPVFPPDRQA